MQYWDDIRYFLAVVRQGSLQNAASDLGVDQSTVFRRLRALEEYLGTRVFDRRRRGRYELTPAGEILVENANRIDDALHDVEHRVRGRDLQLSGPIRVATAEDIAISLLPRHLDAFEQKHPEITVELLTDNRYYSLARNEADIAIRPGFSTDEDRVIPLRVCRNCLGFYASDTYLSRFGVPESRADLVNHNAIEWRKDLARAEFAGSLFSWFGNPGRYGCNSLISARALAVQGLGIALLPEFFGADDSRLKRVLPDLRIDAGHIWLLHHGEMRHTARVRVFKEFMFEALGSDSRIAPARLADVYVPPTA